MNASIDVIKKLLFWPKIKRRLIIRKHRAVSRFCRKLISDYESKPESHYLVTPLKNLNSDKIIWQYWGQGFNNEMPELVRKCLDSVEKNHGEATIIRLSDETISEYLEIPDFVLEKKGLYPKAIFSDLLRCMLLSAYGGCWLDATVLLSEKIPQKYWDADFFLFQRYESETNKKYWSNAFYYYFGWENGFSVRVLNSIIFSQKNNPAITAITQLLLHFWNQHDNLPDYFFFQILFNELVKEERIGNCEIENDCIPHLLQQYINDPDFKLASLNDILSVTPFHKLTYKSTESQNKAIAIIDHITE